MGEIADEIGLGRASDGREMEALRYPIGRFRPRPDLRQHERSTVIDEMATLPARFRDLTTLLDREGW